MLFRKTTMSVLVNSGIVAATVPFASLTRRTGRSRVLIKKTTTVTRCSTIKPTKFTPELRVTNKKTDRWSIAEKMNARLAMLGYVCGSIKEYTSGQNYIEQFQDNYMLVIATTVLVAYSTFVTRNVNVVDEEKPFTSNIELLNGRMVMMGMLLKLMYDSCLFAIP